MWQIVAAPFGG